MRWKCILTPKKGDERKRTKFLFFPLCIDCEWRWLETVIIHQRFEGWDYANFELWKNLEFID